MSYEYYGHVLDEVSGRWVPREEYDRAQATRGVLYASASRPQRRDSFNFLPYRGFDHKKFPRTFITLLMMYNLPDWFTQGKMVGGPYKDLYGQSKEEGQETHNEETENGQTP